jgi:AraC-like DNA-binding protein
MKPTIDDFHVFTLHAGYADLNAHWNWKHVRSPFARLYYVTEGQAQVVIHPTKSNGEEIITLRPHHLYFIPPFTLHSNVCDGVFKHYYIHLLENSETPFHYLTDYTYPRELQATDIDLQLFQTICRINPFLKLSTENPDKYDNHSSLMHNVHLGKQRPLCDKVESRGILYILMSHFLRAAQLLHTITDERIQRAIDYIDSHVDHNIGIESLAEMVSLSKDHFIRLFRKETGMTPIVYTTKRKIEQAETMLVTTNLPIKIIALKLGFEETSYFFRLFKKVTGMPPQQYRKVSL